MTNNILGIRISELLQKNGLTQRELAEQVGVTEVSMSRYVKGERIPRITIAVNIANALHTTVEYLIGQETKDGDTELEHYYCYRAIAIDAKNLSQKQKEDIVNTLFDSES